MMTMMMTTTTTMMMMMAVVVMLLLMMMNMTDCCSGNVGDRVGCIPWSRGAGCYDWSWYLRIQVNQYK